MKRVKCPETYFPKPGGMVDAIKKNKFIEYLSDKWPEKGDPLEELYEEECEKRGTPDTCRTYPDDFTSEKEQETGETTNYK